DEETGEDELLRQLLGDAVRLVFADRVARETVRPVQAWFSAGNAFHVGADWPAGRITAQLAVAAALAEVVRGLLAGEERVAEVLVPAVRASGAEFVLEGMHRSGLLAKRRAESGVVFG